MGALDGKVAIVTGAGRGLGRAHAIALAQEGARVVVNDLGVTTDGQGADASPAQQVVDEIRAAGGQAMAHYGDVATMEDARALIEGTVKEFGGLDILVNNAGIIRDKMLFAMEEEEWDSVIRVHLKGQFAPTRYAAAYWRDLVKQTGKPAGATVFFTSSEAGIYGNVGQANYSAAKGGLTMMAAVAARELGRYGVRSFGICPRARTRMSEAAFSQFKAADGFDSWTPENVSPLIAYLCTEAAGELTGQVFVAAGGMVQLLRWWGVQAEIKQDKRWTVAELTDAVPTLFANYPKGPVAFPDLGVDR